MNVIHVSMPSGGKRGKRTDVNLERHSETKRSVVRIRNKDNLCMARALVVAKSKIDNDPHYKYVANHRKPMQTRLAQELHNNADVPLARAELKKPNGFRRI